MKTRISQLVVVLFTTFFLVTGNVNAKGNEAIASGHENIETALELENWMINENVWETKSFVNIKNSREETLVLEEWMTNKITWEVIKIPVVETEIEQDLSIEQWMINELVWSR